MRRCVCVLTQGRHSGGCERHCTSDMSDRGGGSGIQRLWGGHPCHHNPS